MDPVYFTDPESGQLYVRDENGARPYVDPAMLPKSNGRSDAFSTYGFGDLTDKLYAAMPGVDWDRFIYDEGQYQANAHGGIYGGRSSRTQLYNDVLARAMGAGAISRSQADSMAFSPAEVAAEVAQIQQAQSQNGSWGIDLNPAMVTAALATMGAAGLGAGAAGAGLAEEAAALGISDLGAAGIGADVAGGAGLLDAGADVIGANGAGADVLGDYASMGLDLTEGTTVPSVAEMSAAGIEPVGGLSLPNTPPGAGTVIDKALKKAQDDPFGTAASAAGLGLAAGAAGGGLTPTGADGGSGDNSVAEEARKASLRARINSMYGIDAAPGDTVAAAARQQMSGEGTRLSDATRAYYTDQLGRAYEKAERGTRFKLARQGLLGSSEDSFQNSELRSDRDLGGTRIDEAVRRAVNDLTTQREGERLNAIQLVNSGAGDSAVSAAQAGLKNTLDAANSAQRADIFNDLFAGGANAIATGNAANNEAAFLARYQNGLTSFFPATKTTSGKVYPT